MKLDEIGDGSMVSLKKLGKMTPYPIYGWIMLDMGCFLAG